MALWCFTRLGVLSSLASSIDSGLHSGRATDGNLVEGLNKSAVALLSREIPIPPRELRKGDRAQKTNNAMRILEATEDSIVLPAGTLPTDLWCGFISICHVGLLVASYLWVKKENNGSQDAVANGRTSVLDNAKYWMMVAVILSHLGISHKGKLQKELPWYDEITEILMPWETRVFCLISGMVTQKELSAKDALIFVLKQLVVLTSYAAYISAMPVLDKHLIWVLPRQMPSLRVLIYKALFQRSGPIDVCWYLRCYTIWRLLFSWVQCFQPSVRVSLAVLAAAVFGYFDFHLDRALTYFPIFVIGQLIPYKLILGVVPWHPQSAFVALLLLIAWSVALAPTIGIVTTLSP